MTKEERLEKQREKLEQMTEYERALRQKGIRYIAGVDEVGRGPLAGPVVAAAAVLPADFSVLGVDDSKKLSEKRREELFDLIREQALAYGIGMVDNLVIDEINILEATKLAMKQAVNAADAMLKERLEEAAGIEHVLIDALVLKEVPIPQTGIVKGDAKSVSIAAASILAKVTRDRLMVEYHEKYPFYGFDRNKGYGTKLHYEGIDFHGFCPWHRRSFLKKYMDDK